MAWGGGGCKVPPPPLPHLVTCSTLTLHTVSLVFCLLSEKSRAFTICMEKPVVPVGKQMERFVPTENFRKKSNTFRGITFFLLLPKRLEFSVPFVHITRPWLLSQREQRDSSQDSGYNRNFTIRAKIVTMRRR